jgi:glycosyltransferase involved in cell wall biosynthesis
MVSEWAARPYWPVPAPSRRTNRYVWSRMPRDAVSNQPLVSVVMIFLNAEKFIQEAIGSVFAQTFDQWELLLVDDGSTDSSTEIARTYAAREPERAQYLEHGGHQNRGTSASRNLGIRNARGKYIAFLDADDVWLPHKLEQQIAILSSQPEAAMVYGAPLYWHSWTGNPEDRGRDFVPKLGVPPNTLVKPPTLLPLFLRGEASVPCPSDVVMRREVIESVGGFDEVFRVTYEDQAVFAKICLNRYVFVANQCWDRYRRHQDSVCSIARKTGRAHSNRLFFLNWLESYLSTQGAEQTEIWRVLQKELWAYRHPHLWGLTSRAQHPARETRKLLRWVARRLLPADVRHWLSMR